MGELGGLRSSTALWLTLDVLKQMPDHFDKHYGSGKFEMIQVGDMAKDGCLDGAVKGVFAVCLGFYV